MAARRKAKPISNERFRTILNHARVSLSVSQRELSDRIGCTIGTMTKYLKGDISPYDVRFVIQCKLAKVLGITVDALWNYYETGEYETNLSIDRVAAWIRAESEPEDWAYLLETVGKVMVNEKGHKTITPAVVIQEFDTSLLARLNVSFISIFKETAWAKELSRADAINELNDHWRKFVEARGFDPDKELLDIGFPKVFASILDGTFVYSAPSAEAIYQKYGECPVIAAMQSWTETDCTELVEKFEAAKIERRKPGDSAKKVQPELVQVTRRFSALMTEQLTSHKGTRYTKEGALEYGKSLVRLFNQISLEVNCKPEELFLEICKEKAMAQAARDSEEYTPLAKALLIEESVDLLPEHVSGLFEAYGTCPCFTSLRTYVLARMKKEKEPTSEAILQLFEESERIFFKSIIYDELSVEFLESYFRMCEISYKTITEELALKQKEGWDSYLATDAMQKVEEADALSVAKSICVKGEINPSVIEAKFIMNKYKNCPMYVGLESLAGHPLPGPLQDAHEKLVEFTRGVAVV